MDIIKPSVELWRQDDPIAHVARCARVCYASDKTSDNDAMYKRLVIAGHYSMLRHHSVYYIMANNVSHLNNLKKFWFSPYIDYKVNFDKIYVATNAQFVMEHPEFVPLSKYIVDALTFENTETGHELMRWTFKVVTQISTSRELNRVSPNNIAEQSTRYVNLTKKGGAICQPHWISDEEVNLYKNEPLKCGDKEYVYLRSCDRDFNEYEYLIKNDVLPQDARGILPLDTATVCIYTYSVEEWRNIINLRYFGKTGAPHPNAKIIVGMIKETLEQEGYEFC